LTFTIATIHRKGFQKMRKHFFIIVFLLTFTLLLAACGGGADDTSETEGPLDLAAQGEKLYKQATIGSASSPGCVTCHSLEEGVSLVGPSHASVGARAGDQVAGQSAEDYIKESIINPNTHVVDGYSPGVMYQNYAKELTDEQIDALVAYMLGLR
jgi:cytochrome c oxidase subunit 2